MNAPLATVMRECKNYFIKTVERGAFQIKDGAIEVKDVYLPGQYLRIVGSILNDGVYRAESAEDGKVSFVQAGGYEPWKKPEGAHDAYKTGDKVSHNDIRYVSRIDANVYEPGTDARWWEPVAGVELESFLQDEVFAGAVCGLAVPPDFIGLVNEIAEFERKRANMKGDPTLISESYAGYNYVKATDGQGGIADWKSAFASRLVPYKKMFEERVI